MAAAIHLVCCCKLHNPHQQLLLQALCKLLTATSYACACSAAAALQPCCSTTRQTCACRLQLLQPSPHTSACTCCHLRAAGVTAPAAACRGSCWACSGASSWQCRLWGWSVPTSSRRCCGCSSTGLAAAGRPCMSCWKECLAGGLVSEHVAA